MHHQFVRYCVYLNVAEVHGHRHRVSTFTATDPRTGEPTGPAFTEATSSAVAAAVASAERSAGPMGAGSRSERARLLRRIAEGLEADAGALVADADRETALGEARLTSELARTTAQLRFLAEVVEQGWYVEPVIDVADASATPPRPDLRRMLVPRGPVAVFGAGNFPLAFGVAGADTASALAVGCPVVFKAHPDHPTTSDRSGAVISEALVDVGLPPSAFSLLHGVSTEVGATLVTQPGIHAVGFTGSLDGGRALFDLAARRPDPIPVYAEMGSLNPVFVTSAALEVRGAEVAQGFVDSMNLGTGQFCTKPGIVVVPSGAAADRFVATVAALVEERAAGLLLSQRHCDRLESQFAATAALDGVEVIAQSAADGGGLRHRSVVLRVHAATLLGTPQLLEEHFGPVAILVQCAGTSLEEVAAALPGGLTATIHAEDTDDIDELVRALRDRAGRLVFNGFPTGVAVTWAMHHGGPWPATTDAAHTSVGAMALRRWLRSVAYQDAPAQVLPPALRDDNPDDLLRLVAGRWTRDAW